MSKSNRNHLPLITIQHDLPQVVLDIQNGSVSAEDIWISCYSKSPNSTGKLQSIHAKVRITHHDLDSERDHNDSLGLPHLEPRDGIQCHWANQSSISQLKLMVGCEALSISPTLVSFPSQTMKGVQPNGMECMDVNGEWVVTGGKNGNLRLDSWKSFDFNSNQYRIGRGHLSDLTSCQFFPSGEVILTTSIDMSARIYSIHPDPGKPTLPSLMLNPRTFAAPHGRSVVAASIIEKGKEIITACKDGKIRVWNVSESKVVMEHCVVLNESDQILSMKIGTKRFLNRLGEHTSPSTSESEQGNDTQFLAIGLSSGALHFLHVPSLKPVKCLFSEIHQVTSSAIDTMAISESGELMACATRSGRVTIFVLDWQITSSSSDKEEEVNPLELLSIEPFTSWTRTESSVNSLKFSQDGNQLLVGGNDGLPYSILIKSTPLVLEEFAGFDCDPVQSVHIEHETKNIFLAGKDGSILIYR